MANSISINSDMTKLIFVSSSGTTEFDLAGDGVILRLLNESDVEANSATSIITGSGVVESTEHSSWTLSFCETNKKVFFIGIDDVDVSITNPRGHQFDLSEERLNIRRTENSLIVVAGT